MYLAVVWTLYAASRADQRRITQAIVVLGAAQYNGKPSPVLRARLDHALTLYHAGLAPEILVLGGQAQGDHESEAQVGAHYLAEHGVAGGSATAIPEGKSTASSMAALARWGSSHGVHTVLLVSDPFHSLRLRIEARRAGLEGYTSPTRTSPISARWNRELAYLLGEGFKVPAAWLRALIS